MNKAFDRIYIELSNICNFNCPFCSGVKNNPRSLTFDEFMDILNQVCKYTDEICLHVLGEPLLYKHFDEVLKACQSKAIKINLVTNGYFINDKIDIIKRYFSIFKKISFSVHSYVYQHEKVDEKLFYILKASVLLSELGVSVEIRNLFDNLDAEFTQSLVSSILQETCTQLIDVSKNQKIKEKLYYVVKKPFVWPDKSKATAKCNHINGKMYCLGGKTHIAILSDLTVVPCCLDTAGEINLGNLKYQSLSEILASQKYIDLCKLFQNGKPCHALCATCKYSQK